MAFLSKVQLSCFLLSYLVAFGGELFQLLRHRSGMARGITILAAAAGLLAHTAYLVTRSSDSGLPPLIGSSHDWFLVLAWLGAFFYLILVATHRRLALGLFLLPSILSLIIMALFVDDVLADSVREKNAVHRWGMLHASTLLIGLGTVAASTMCAVMYLLQYQKLRGQSSWLHRLQLPSLERLNSFIRWLVVSTVIMLTVGLATGFILVMVGQQPPDGSFSWKDPLVAGTSIVWLTMVSALCRILARKEQTGRQVARLTLMAGGFLLVTVLGLTLLSGGIHGSSPGNVGEMIVSPPESSLVQSR
ncbi:MAG: cytochrome c biogenesis protein CcsA [Fuerstiella sp.]